MAKGKRIWWKNGKEKNIVTWGHSRKNPLERKNPDTFEQKLTFNMTYYPTFPSFRDVLRKLRSLLAPDKEHKKVFPDVLVGGIYDGENCKGYVIRAVSLKINEIGRCWLSGRKTFLVCTLSATMTFTKKIPRKNFPRNFFTIIIAFMVTETLMFGILLFLNNLRHISL